MFKLPEIKIKPNKEMLFKWVLYSHMAFISLTLMFLFYPTKNRADVDKRYTIYISKPLVLNQSKFEITMADARAQRINNIFRDYKCPLEGLGDVFVREADKNNIPWYMVAAISFQESSCGKNTPYVDGEPTYNAWGYAVYGDNVHGFDNWVNGIEVMSRYLSKRFYSQGITKSSDIMATYTPPSMGSWYKGVDYFSNLIQNYSSN